MTVPMLAGHPLYLSLTTTEPNGEGHLVRAIAEKDCVTAGVPPAAGGTPAVRTAGEVADETPTARAKAGGAGVPARERFERLVRGPRLTLAQCRMAGVTNAQLDGAGDLDRVLEELLEFSADSREWIVPRGAAARAALRAAAASAGFPGRLGPPVVGLDDLASVVFPALGSLADLQKHYGLAPVAPASLPVGATPTGTEAGATFEALKQLWPRVLADLLKLPLPLLAEMNWMLAKIEHPLKALLKAAEGVALKEQFGDTFSAGKLSFDKLFKDFSPIIERLHGEAPVWEDASSPEARPGEIERLFSPQGPLAQGLEGYEERAEQVEMAQRVDQALAAGRHLLAEAGTGVGKSLAYLVPAILFARRAGRPVMISTHTKNLQAQLFYKDLPLLRQRMGVDFKAALLKGRPNYLCLRKFTYTLQEAPQELDEEERAEMLPIASWAAQTDTGDVSELAGFSPDKNYALWDRLHTVGDDCLKRQCPFYSRCFVYKARGQARAADVVVLNHALVFAELNLEAGTLPPYREIVFDEAHKLEDVATEHLATEITPRRIQRILGRLYRVAQGASAGTGLLPALLGNLEHSRSDFPNGLAQSIRDRILAAMQAIAPAGEGSDALFATLRQWTEQSGEGGDEYPAGPYVPMERGRGGVVLEPDDSTGSIRPLPVHPPFRSRKPAQSDERKRYCAASLRPHETESFQNGKESAIARLGLLRQALVKLEDDFKEIRKRNVSRARELTTEIAAQNGFLAELIHDIEFVIKGDGPNYVYWTEKLGRRARAVAAPLDVSGLLHEQLYAKKRAIIFASATLSVRDPEAAEGSGLAPIRGPGFQPAKESGQDARATPHPKSFEFVKNRLGLSLCEAGRLEELLLGSPFDYDAQCRLLVPSFLPEPGARDKDFNALFANMLGELAVASGGRAMALYTSYAALESSARALRKMLAPEGIEVLAQGADGSRESLLARLKAGGRTLLLGTSSFWEGVDVRGDALSLLVIAKLPFAVFTDPIIQGRCELLEAGGKDPFLHYSVPTAILRLRQGFGRLIRSRADRGVVVLADKRVLTRRYGAAFLRALPAQARTVASQDALTAAVKNFL